MKKLYIIFIIISFGDIQAQNFVVVDSSFKQAIPYVAIRSLKLDSGFYCNQYGAFSLQNTENDTIELSCLGFKNAKKPISSLKDTIYLQLEAIALKEIVVKYNKKVKIKSIGYSKKSKKISFFIKKFDELGVLIKPVNSYKNCFIKSIKIPISKSKLGESHSGKLKKTKEFSSIFKLNLYEPNKSNNQAINLLAKPITVKCNQNSKSVIEIDISKYHIKFTDAGIFIAIQMIGELDKNGNYLNRLNPLPSFKLTGSKSKNLVSRQYYKFTFINKWKQLTAQVLHLPKEHHLAIGLDLYCY